MNRDLALAIALADLADGISLARFRAHDLVVDTKPDLTPVTEADRAVERALRDRIGTERPGDRVLGEEFGESGGEGPRWLIDPIDGTKNYTRGIPIWATLIALERDGEIVAGVVSAPALARRWWACRGEGARLNGEPIRVSHVDRIENAAVSDVPALAPRAWHARELGDFWQHMLVAEGALDVAFDRVVNPWDLAPLLLIVEEAGGRMTDVDGDARIDGGSALSSNGLLHAEALAALAFEREQTLTETRAATHTVSRLPR